VPVDDKRQNRLYWLVVAFGGRRVRLSPIKVFRAPTNSQDLFAVSVCDPGRSRGAGRRMPDRQRRNRNGPAGCHELQPCRARRQFSERERGELQRPGWRSNRRWHDTRWRLGVAPCLELLVDLPTYFAAVRGPGSSGFSDITPAIKWQVSPVPGKIDLSLVAGVALPTGAIEIAGPGAQPYLQMPWSWELHDGWGVSGMLTEFFRPADMTTKRVTETTFSIEKKVTEKTRLFVEYVGDYPENAGPSVLLNSGGLYRLSPTQQVDFRVAFGLNHNAPSYIVGVGYSFRFDGLFASRLK
jgi:hypothetical protein